MAQWIPKTAWKAQNLSKIYGVGEIGLFTGDQVLPPKIAKPGNFQKAPFLATPFRPVPSVVPQHQQKDNSQFKEAKAALNSPPAKATADGTAAIMRDADVPDETG